VILRVGLTGGIASGKSTIARMFGALGCGTIDADAIVASLYRPGSRGHEALVRVYGPDILLPNGEVDRPKLATIAFAGAPEAARLNSLIHPLVIDEEARLMKAEEVRAEGAKKIVMVEATLLLESGGRGRCEKIIVVDVAPEVQIARAVVRGISAEEAARRIARQMSREERLRSADYVIDNSGDRRHAESETRRVYEQLCGDLERKAATAGK
jgi:dephospho-CoA kinase